MGSYTERLTTFTEQDLPNLDDVVLGALELFTETDVPAIDFKEFSKPLVVGSGNAAATGRILFHDCEAVFADESTYQHKLDTQPDIDGAVLISASGGKHALPIAAELERRYIKTLLLTNNPEAPAKSHVLPEDVYVFPKNREPYTYNTSTYLGMILSKTKEDPQQISDFIHATVAASIPDNLAEYGAYYFLVPEQFDDQREMIATKCNELFGPRVMARVFTPEQTKHAKTVIPHDTELFISFGDVNEHFGKPENRVTIPLPAAAGYAAFMAISYYVVGRLQRQLPPFYKEHIATYVQETSRIFGSQINVVVE